MSFIQKIDFCLEPITDGYEIIVHDNTGVYHSVNNPTGWNNAATLLVSDLTEATITVKYTDSKGNIVTTVTDVLDQIDNPVTGFFDFEPFVFQGDGNYLITSTLKTDTDTFTVCKQKMLYPEVACCISSKVTKLASDLENKELLQLVTKLKMYEKALYTSSKTIDLTTALSVLNTLEKLCAKGCGCGC
jgi:hypothetical protein